MGGCTRHQLVPLRRRGRATLSPGGVSVWLGCPILQKLKVLSKTVTSSGAHLDYDQAFPGAQFVGDCTDDFLHRGGHRHPDGCVGVVHTIDLEQNYWEGGSNVVS